MKSKIIKFQEPLILHKLFQKSLKCHAFRDLVSFVQFKKREETLRRNFPLLKVTFLHECFSNCANRHKWKLDQWCKFHETVIDIVCFGFQLYFRC